MNAEQSRQIEELYLELYHKLMAYACSSIDNISLAEEAVQEAFRIACQKPESVCNSDNPQGWIFITLKNTIRNIKSNQVSAKHLLEQYLLTYANEIIFTDNKLSVDVMYENVAELEEFQLLKEMAIDGKSHQEMAEKRGISVNACKKRVQRAKELLQKKLKESL